MQKLLSLVIKVSDNTIEYSVCKGTKIIQINLKSATTLKK